MRVSCCSGRVYAATISGSRMFGKRPCLCCRTAVLFANTATLSVCGIVARCQTRNLYDSRGNKLVQRCSLCRQHNYYLHSLCRGDNSPASADRRQRQDEYDFFAVRACANVIR
ncbi:hypothetical protein SISNIDRAFT_335761 [Sistotremastrum niveocremeum HHB9708]|uniref:Uncharacterized protein n=2 Tax=Sistotremastraceae TaxID=3402574 RepID=A0A164XK05_9AGAM|nr:hypothetical protein SISNIDRAFT_335761 [Sistotremastrum niveocremeum HHB9708]KZT44612.1 hypothetical protein SISSUDRAFT_35535 [Sistotremastrum suecicum HHB10207 ss-3]